jgi:hypothetical protein
MQVWLLPLGAGRVQSGKRVLISRTPDLTPMGKDLALGYFRGAKPRARLWLPVSTQKAGHTLVAWNREARRAEIDEAFPLANQVLNQPLHTAVLDPIDWQQLGEEADLAVQRAEAGPPTAGLVELAYALDQKPVPAAEPQMAFLAAKVLVVAKENSPVSALPEVTVLAAALPRLQFRTSNGMAPAGTSRQLRLRPQSSRSGEPPLAGTNGGPVRIEPRAGSREGKLGLAELPLVLAPRPQGPTLPIRPIQARGIPNAGQVNLVTFRQASGVFRPFLTLPGEPLAGVELAYPVMRGIGAELVLGAVVELPLPPSRGTAAHLSLEEHTPVQPQPYLEPPASVKLSAPVLDPPLSSLRALAVRSRNPVDSRRPATVATGERADYRPEIERLPSLEGLGPRTPLMGRLIGGPATAATGKTSPMVREEGWPVPVSGQTAAVALPLGSGYSPASHAGSAGTPGLAVRLFALPHDRLLPRDAARRPSSQLEPFAAKGFVILSSSRLKLRTGDQRSLTSRFRVSLPSLPKLPNVPKWGAGVVMAVAVAVFLSTGTPPASGTITPSEPSAWTNFQQTIMKRAAIALTDDFRSGLGDWTGKEGWGKSWSFDNTGFVRTGALALYSPSVTLNDYRFEFLGQIEKKALSWVVRAADLENYQTVRLELGHGGPVPRAYVVRYPVVNGKRGKETRTDLPLAVTPDTVYRVAMDVHGADHVLMVQGQVVDSWTEENLPRGGVGFFSGAGERARLRWIGVWHQYDALGRLCAYLAPRQPGSIQ